MKDRNEEFQCDSFFNTKEVNNRWRGTPHECPPVARSGIATYATGAARLWYAPPVDALPLPGRSAEASFHPRMDLYVGVTNVAEGPLAGLVAQARVF